MNRTPTATPKIETARVGLEDYRNLLIDRVRSELREDAHMLRALDCTPKIATSAEEAEAMSKLKPLMTIKGFLALSADADKGRAFELDMEMGLTESEDEEIAKQLAEHCHLCVLDMKKAHKRKQAYGVVQ